MMPVGCTMPAAKRGRMMAVAGRGQNTVICMHTTAHKVMTSCLISEVAS